MYDQLALESVSNTNLGKNLKMAKNKDISARLRDHYVFQLLNIELPTCLKVCFKYVLLTRFIIWKAKLVPKNILF